MNIKQVATFMTSDGKTFNTLPEAEAHEIGLEMEAEIDRVVAAHEINQRTLVTLKRWLPVFIQELGYVKRCVPQPDLNLGGDADADTTTSEDLEAA